MNSILALVVLILLYYFVGTRVGTWARIKATPYVNGIRNSTGRSLADSFVYALATVLVVAIIAGLLGIGVPVISGVVILTILDMLLKR